MHPRPSSLREKELENCLAIHKDKDKIDVTIGNNFI